MRSHSHLKIVRYSAGTRVKNILLYSVCVIQRYERLANPHHLPRDRDRLAKKHKWHLMEDRKG